MGIVNVTPDSFSDGGDNFDPEKAVHPTFLYESIWCIAVFILLHIVVTKFRKFKGEIFLLYGIFYGLERTVVEGLRTDSLYVPNTAIRVSQLLSAVIVVVFTIWLIVMFVKLKRGTLSRKYLINPPPIPFELPSAPVGVSYRYANGKGTSSDTDFFKVIKEDK